MVVFNLKKFTQDSAQSLEFVTFWMNSIRLHAADAPALLIGTYLDELTTSQKKRRKKLGEINSELIKALAAYPQLVQNRKDRLSFFPISNKENFGLDKVKAQIGESSDKQEFIHRRINMNWLRCLDLITEEEHGSWVSLKKVGIFAAKLGIDGEAEISTMLKLFHELGVIIHFDSTDALQQVIVISPQWLIDQISLVIRDKELHAHNDAVMYEVGLEEDYNTLNEQAVASFDLLHYFWGGEKVQFFIDLMRHTLLLSEWKYGNKELEKSYLVPCLLDDGMGDTPIPKDNVIKCKFDFGNTFLPDGCFQRLLCLCVGYFHDFAFADGNTSPSEGQHDPVIHSSFAKIYLSSTDSALYLKRNKDHILLAIQGDVSAKKYLSVIRTMLRKINEDTMDSGLKWSVLLEEKPDVFIPELNARRRKLAPWFSSATKAEDDDKKEEERRRNIDLFLSDS